jgi:hypothetical protein
MFSRETVEWVVCRGEADVKCTRRDTDRGIELSVWFRGLLVARCVASTMTHAANWAANRLDSWRAAGYEVLRSTADRGDAALTR